MAVQLTLPADSPTAPEGMRYLNPRAITRVHYGDSRPNPYAYGYGRRIPTGGMLTLSDNRARRVYAMCYGNSGSLYVIVGGRVAHLDSWAEGYLEDARDTWAREAGASVVREISGDLKAL